MPEFSRLVSSREKLQLVRSCKFSKGFLLGRKQQWRLRHCGSTAATTAAAAAAGHWSHQTPRQCLNHCTGHRRKTTTKTDSSLQDQRSISFNSANISAMFNRQFSQQISTCRDWSNRFHTCTSLNFIPSWKIWTIFFRSITLSHRRIHRSPPVGPLSELQINKTHTTTKILILPPRNQKTNKNQNKNSLQFTKLLPIQDKTNYLVSKIELNRTNSNNRQSIIMKMITVVLFCLNFFFC